MRLLAVCWLRCWRREPAGRGAVGWLAVLDTDGSAVGDVRFVVVGLLRVSEVGVMMGDPVWEDEFRRLEDDPAREGPSFVPGQLSVLDPFEDDTELGSGVEVPEVCEVCQ